MANIKSRRKLSDLYKRGVEVRFGPDGGKIADISKNAQVGYFLDEDGKKLPLRPDEIQMWITPPSPLQREMAMRDAQGARARSLVRAKRHEDSEEHLTILAFLADMDEETLLDYVIAAEIDTHRGDAIREVLAEPEWENMTALQESMRHFEEMPEAELEGNEEYQALMELDEKFGKQVSERERQITDAAREILRMRPREAIERRALDKRAELVGSQAFMHEYEAQMLFYSVRDFDDTGVLFFESARELAEADDDVRDKIREAVAPFIADAAEAKNSPGAVSGSASSEPPSEPETSDLSTREVANA